MILNILTDAIRYALTKPKNLLILGILNFFNLLIIPLIFTMGYYYKVTQESTRGMINGDEKMPPLNNFKQLFIDGFKVLIVGLIYCIPVFISYIILYYLSDFGYLSYNLVEPISNSVLFMCYCYFYISLPNMAYHDSFKKAFDFKQINEIILKRIGVIPVIIVLLIIDFLEFTFKTISIDFAYVLNKLLNPNSFSTHALTFIFGTLIISILITPFIDIMLSRATGLLYVSDK